MKSAYDGFFNYHIGTTWQTSTIETDVVFTNTNNNSFLNINLGFNNFNVDIESERYYFGNLDVNNTYYFFDIVARYNLKSKGLSLTLKGLNMFNNQIFREVLISDISTTINEYRLLPRFILLGLDFRF